jgi:hypothetical protein
VRGDAQDDGGEDKLRDAEDHGDQVGEDHGCGLVVLFWEMCSNNGVEWVEEPWQVTISLVMIRYSLPVVLRSGRIFGLEFGWLRLFIRGTRVLDGNQPRLLPWLGIYTYDFAVIKPRAWRDVHGLCHGRDLEQSRLYLLRLSNMSV